jgi:hypothetical protein
MSAPDSRRSPVWPVAALVVAGLVIATAAAVVSDTTGFGAPAETSATRVTETVTETVTSGAVETVTVAASPAAGPAAEFGDGTHIVGLNIAPGTYRTAGPSGTNPGGCYWSRRKADRSSIVDYDVAGGPAQITVDGGELVEANGCQTWVRA